ncbi:glutamate 5-kinase [Aquibacillus sediminis]|uniref:glutamate 5-kinase n=1 Tax=Aquibacillus sediminis TaxID=2574734 RepID=UPI001108D1FD|nr:glutamate 5-kinase [Aquibacillus sediminis]
MAKKRIVVKIGSSSLTNRKGGLSKEKLNAHAASLAHLKQKGYEVILISSGAVSAGFGQLGYPTRPVTVAGKQAAAAVGQGLLIQAYTDFFASKQIATSQLLLTRDNFANKEQYSNVYSTLTELLKRNVVPIINENDTVAVNELTFGDNDMLSALVSGLVNADFLIILTDVNGLYEYNPHTKEFGDRFDYVSTITNKLFEQTNGETKSKFGTGGMKSKLLAAQTAQSLGINVFIGTGKGEEKLLSIVNGQGDGTYIGEMNHKSVRKQRQWIAFHSKITGKIMIDDGAEKALLLEGRSLLPAGVIAIKGNFDAGDVVEIYNKKRQVIAKGQVSYSSKELHDIKGMSSDLAMPMTNRTKPEVIHRDNLVLSFKEVYYS